MIKKITSVLCALIGVAVIILGFTLGNVSASYSADSGYYHYKANNYNITDYTFGADFYTEIYEGANEIVDVLNEINHSMETVISAENNLNEIAVENVKATNSLNRTVAKIGSITVVAIGLMILAYGLVQIGKSFDTPKAAPSTADSAPFSQNSVSVSTTSVDMPESLPQSESSSVPEETSRP